MRTVVMDIRANHNTGVARYGHSALRALAPLLDACDLRLVVVARPAQVEVAASAIEAAPPGLVQIEACPDDDGFVRRSPWLHQLLNSVGADLYYSTHYSADRTCPVRFAITIHDLTRLRFPNASYTDESFTAEYGAQELGIVAAELDALRAWDAPSLRQSGQVFTRYFWALNKYLVAKAARVVTVSESSARDLRRMLGVPDSSLSVVPGGVDRDVFHPRPWGEVAHVRERWGIKGPYCLFVGLAHPHKRLPWLLNVLAEWRLLLPEGSRLVIVGGDANQSLEVRKLLVQLQLHDYVILTGRVTDHDLAALYSGAAALINASLNEGSGLPAQEALACGCNAIVADIAALRETLGQAGLFFPPTDAAALGALVRAALQGELPRRGSAFKPRSWDDAGRRLASALLLALNGTRCPTAL